eukprot:931574-Pelagomonas_calceolata.AAC.1
MASSRDRQLHNEIHRHTLPSSPGDGKGLYFPTIHFGTDLVFLAGIAMVDIVFHIRLHSIPVKVTRY